jgi:hypothetical protein
VRAVVEQHDGHLAAPRHLRARRHHHPGQQHRLALRFQLTQAALDEGPDLGGIGVEGMAGKEEAERRLFLHQALALSPARYLDIVHGIFLRAAARVEQPALQGVALGLLGRFERDAGRRQQLGAMIVDAVEGAGADQRLDHPPVHHALVDAAAEIEQVAETIPPFRAP